MGLGSRIRNKHIPDHGSGSRCQKGTGSRIRIRNTARLRERGVPIPTRGHTLWYSRCIFIWTLCSQHMDNRAKSNYSLSSQAYSELLGSGQQLPHRWVHKGTSVAVLLIRIFPSWSGPATLKNLSILIQKFILSPWKYDLGCSSRIPDLGSVVLHLRSRIGIQAPEVEKSMDPGSGSATLLVRINIKRDPC